LEIKNELSQTLNVEIQGSNPKNLEDPGLIEDLSSRKTIRLITDTVNDSSSSNIITSKSMSSNIESM
jgi:hypothetical protein